MPRTSVGSLRATGPPLFAGEGALRAGWARCATRAKRGTGGSTGTCQPRDNVVHAYADKAYRVRKSGSWEVEAVTAVGCGRWRETELESAVVPKRRRPCSSEQVKQAYTRRPGDPR